MVAVGSFAFAGRAEPAASLEPPLSPLSLRDTHCVSFLHRGQGDACVFWCFLSHAGSLLDALRSVVGSQDFT